MTVMLPSHFFKNIMHILECYKINYVGYHGNIIIRPLVIPKELLNYSRRSPATEIFWNASIPNKSISSCGDEPTLRSRLSKINRITLLSKFWNDNDNLLINELITQ